MFNRSSVMVRSVGKPPSKGKSPAQLTVVERVSGQVDGKRRAGLLYSYHVIVPPGGGHSPISRRIVMICPRWWLLCMAPRRSADPRDSRARLAMLASDGSSESASESDSVVIRFASSIDLT